MTRAITSLFDAVLSAALSVLLVAALVGVPFAAYAEESSSSAYASGTSADTTSGSTNETSSALSSDAKPFDASDLPSEYYLTNLGYVTPAKVQSPWGTCWAFAAISAVESSILKAQAKLEANVMHPFADEDTSAGSSAEGTSGTGSSSSDPSSSTENDTDDLERVSMAEPRLSGLNYTIDLSERALGWFAHEPQSIETAGAQAGEGFSQPDGLGRLSQFEGGNFAIASAILAARQSLLTENNAPYRYNGYDGGDVMWYDGGSYAGASDDSRMKDWSLENEIRVSEEVGWYVSGIRNMESPAILETDYSTGASKYMGYNPAGTAAIKQALTQIGAVAISIQADLSVPSEIAAGDAEYESHGDTINYDNWAQFNGLPEVTLNHAVTIVGWDDGFSAQNFGSSQGGMPPTNGAWLCKNNWGSDDFYTDMGDPDASIHWGIRDAQTQKATGFFWVSYYDHSLSGPVAFEVSPVENDILYQYDYLGSSEFEAPSTYTGDVLTANVFETTGVELIDSVCGWTFGEHETVSTWIFALPDDSRGSKVATEGVHPIASGKVSALDGDTDPNRIVDGDSFAKALEGAQLIAEKEVTFEHAGFHTIELDIPALLYKGEKFAVIQEIKAELPGSSGIMVPSSYLNLEISFVDSLALKAISSSSKVVSNPGETFVSVFGEGVWDSVEEYNEWYRDLKTQGNMDVDMVFGNALIKAVGKDTSMSHAGRIYELVKLDAGS